MNTSARIALGSLAICFLASSAGAQKMSDSAMMWNRPVPPLAPSEVKFLSGYTDANILGHLARNDSIEIGIADAAIRRSRSDKVLDYAKLMILDHRTAMALDRQIARETGLGMTTLVGDLRRSHMGASIDSVDIASDLTVDRHYIMSQVEMHQHMLAELQTLRDVAQNARVRAQIDALIPVVRQHLAKAHALAVMKGLESRPKS